MKLDKPTLRRAMRLRRRALSAAQRHEAAEGLWRQLSSHLHLSRYRCVALYLANDGEVDPLVVSERRHRARQKVYLPVIHRALGLHMLFAPYAPGAAMQRNRFGIPEPRCARSQLQSARRMNLILIPLVAFDAAGNRLGMGGGYYDRTLAFLRARRHWRQPLLVGAAYDFQQVDQLPSDPWDVPLQYVVTPSRVIRVGGRP